MRTCLPRLDAVASLGALAVEPHLPRAQQLLQRAMAERGIMPLEPAIQTDAVIVLRDLDRFDAHRIRTIQSPANSASTDSTAEPAI